MPYALLLVVTSLVVMVALLAGVTWFEQRVLSPRSIILHTARCRSARPEHAEALVQLEAERLLAAGDLARPVPDRPQNAWASSSPSPKKSRVYVTAAPSSNALQVNRTTATNRGPVQA